MYHQSTKMMVEAFMADREPILLVDNNRAIAYEYKTTEVQNHHTGTVACEPESVNGETRFFDNIKLPLRDETGAIIGMLRIGRDVTEERNAANMLKESEERFRLIFEQAPQGIFLADSDCRIIKTNETFCRMIGYTEEELCGRTFGEITRSDHTANSMTEIDELTNERVPFLKRERQFIKKNQEVLWGAWTTGTIRGNDGRFQYFISFVEDITERKKREIREAHLKHQRFQREKMDAVSALAGGIAHDFNNVLTLVIGFGSLLQTKMSADDPGQNYLSQIIASSKRAVHLTTSLLAFGRKQEIDLKPVRVNDIVIDTVKHLRKLLTDDIELKIAMTAEDPAIMADISQINQILINFTTNAREAMPKGGSLTIATHTTVLDEEFARTHGYGKPGTYAAISLTDTGIGMSDKIKEHVFEPFFTTKGMNKGVGLGLSIVYGAMKQHKGFVTVASEIGKGSTFTILFPLTDDEPVKEEKVPVQETTQDKESKSTAGVNDKGIETIIVAEDDPWVRGFIAEVLKEHGYKTIEATDGEDAIRLCAEHKGKVDLVVIDVDMPLKDGIEVYKEIRKTYPDMKTLFTSGYSDDLIAGRGIEGGRYDFISKPLSLDSLLRKVREVIDR